MTISCLMLILGLAHPALAADDAKAPAPADADTVKMVEFFIKAPVSDLPADHIQDFMDVNPDSLPKKLVEPFKGKRLELYTLKQEAAGKKRGVYRMPEKDCEITKDAKSDDLAALKIAGYQEITDDEEKCVEEHTKCTEHDMLCEFSLQIAVETVVKKNKKTRIRHLFLHQNDVLMAVVAECRADVGAATNFFGTMKPACAGH
jgi:hypothetical protein